MERLLTIEDVTDLLQMPARFVERQIRMAYLDVIQIGTEVRVEAPAHRRYVENREAMTPLVGQQRLRAVD